MKIYLVLLIISSFFIFSCKNRQAGIPLPEHPRPGFQRAVWQNLNGYWKFRPDSADIGIQENWQEEADFFDQKILVPFSWASPMSEIKLPHIHTGWYSRKFTLQKPSQWKEKQVYLVFCASDFNTTLWVNGKRAGSHAGGYVPFDFNITGWLQEGENTIVVRVEDEELTNRPSGKQYYGNAKGIWQTVYLEARPDIYFTSVRFTPDIDKQLVRVDVSLSESADSPLNFSLKGINNNLEFQEVIPSGQTTATYTVPVSEMKLWSPESPFLYEITAGLNGSNTGDEISGYFGMRKISAMEIPGQNFQYVALNNEPVYLKLSLDQSYHPEGFYTFPTDLFMKEEIMRAKNLGLNGLRIHIKTEIPRKLYWADKLGLLIQADIPNFWGEPDSTAKINWEYIATRQLERDYNHPSIFSWVLFNETWGLFSNDSTGKREYLPETQEWVESWYHKTKAYDPTRLVEDNSPCNWDHVATDINTWHSYLPARNWANFLDHIVENTFPGSTHNFIGGNVQANQPMFNSECGAVWGYQGSTGDIDLTWEYHIMMNEFRKRPKIAGFLFTEFHDVINEWNGYYRFDRSQKRFGLDELVPGMAINDFHKDLYVIPGDDFYRTYAGGEKVKFPIGISAVTGNMPGNLTIRYDVYGWDELGDRFSHVSGEIPARAVPFQFVHVDSLEITLPEKNAVMILSTLLVSGDSVIHRNFLPFRVNSGQSVNPFSVTCPPAAFKEASWSIKQHSPQDGNKVWGMGSGYFEYEFILPAQLKKEDVETMEFRVELASRYPQGKYLEEGDAERIGMTIVTQKGTDPGYGKNSYPQTDEKLHGSLVKITANDQLIGEVELTDDPADHQGILSWLNQKPGKIWGSDDSPAPWLLDEAGSYGYLVTAELDETARKSAIESGKVTIRLLVDESTQNRGGLSIYGKNSGKYPMDLTLVINRKPVN